MTSLMAAALHYAQRGWHLFPLQGLVHGRCTCGRTDCSSPGKHPLVRRGLHEASTDEAQIRRWWRQWPSANIAVATGSKSGIVVIDIDLPRALESLDALVHKLPVTLTAITGGGGLHLIYRRASRPLRCTSARVPGIRGDLPGIDVRADGGYIVAPPSLHASGERYRWLGTRVDIDDPNGGDEPDDGEKDDQCGLRLPCHAGSLSAIADLPDWLREPPRRVVPIPPAVGFSGSGTAYGLAVLDKQLAILGAAKVGERNHVLNRCAFNAARHVRGGHISEFYARQELSRVAYHIGLTDLETRRTLDSAFRAAS
ncbi:MAG: bifunctional DNA primase/polymerase [Actinomycetota bacterium]